MVTSVVMKDDDLERIYDVLEVSTGRVMLNIFVYICTVL